MVTREESAFGTLLRRMRLAGGLSQEALAERSGLSVQAVAARGSTNLPRPVPWPWRPAPAAIQMLGPAGRLFTGIYFVLLPAFALSVAIAILQSRFFNSSKSGRTPGSGGMRGTYSSRKRASCRSIIS